MKHQKEEEPSYMGENREHLVLYTKEYIKTHPDVDFFVYGHRHIELDLMLTKKARMIILGDWISQFTYAMFDGEHMYLGEYVEGESEM
jgi:UDP-2,3-diacylglucosamine hydrolase